MEIPSCLSTPGVQQELHVAPSSESIWCKMKNEDQYTYIDILFNNNCKTKIPFIISIINLFHKFCMT